MIEFGLNKYKYFMLNKIVSKSLRRHKAVFIHTSRFFAFSYAKTNFTRAYCSKTVFIHIPTLRS